MGPPNDWHARQFATPSHEISLRHVGRRIKFKCDGSVSGFFDEDYANDADWKKFTEKGGALSCGLDGDDKVADLQMGDTRNPPYAASSWIGDLQGEMTE
ncbi:hypothetical protein E8E12_005640 [Didymella heteroderae]|uniref:Uncharacterized protein n=1 Tax=Didymella heteroderae TaxID=1769908 RepID=A0A9P4WJT2_9PLEO|nr:hypothetical protein E8E12_005640 [Didymella heteroderae]